MIDHLVGLLRRAGLDPTAEEVADALWLAEKLGPRDVAPRDERGITESQQQQNGTEVGPPKGGGEASKAPGPPVPQGKAPQANLHQAPVASAAGATPTRRGIAFASPAASALPQALDIARALRPLKRCVASRTTFVLDEDGTARRMAERVPFPIVVQPARVRWLDIVVIVDEAATMAIWHQTIRELLSVLERHGAFRRVIRRTIVTDNSGDIQVFARLADGTRRVTRILELADPAKRRVVLVVSDCVSRSWDDGRMAQFLEDLGRRTPVSVLQVLPMRLWDRTGVGSGFRVGLRARAPLANNVDLVVTRSFSSSLASLDVREAPLVPVMAIERESIEAWARFVTGFGQRDVIGLGFTKVEQVGDEDAGAAGTTETARERVAWFRTTSTMLARQLAVLFAAAHYLSLPVMRQIWQSMLPQATLGHLAEVFMGGILRQIGAADAAADPEYVRYGFLDEDVRQLLLDGSDTSAAEVLVLVSDYVTQHLGHTTSFRALLADPTGDASMAAVPEEELPFAKIGAAVLRRLGGDYAALARRLEQMLPRVANVGETQSSDLSSVNWEPSKADEGPQEARREDEQDAVKSATASEADEHALAGAAAAMAHVGPAKKTWQLSGLGNELHTILATEPDRVMVVVGAGIPLGALQGTEHAARASWGGLIRDGIAYAQALGHLDAAEAEVLARLLDSPKPGFWISAAEQLTQVLGGRSGGDFRAWLRRSVGAFAPAVRDRSVLDVLVDLERRGTTLATVNYDSLLEDATGLPAVTWREPSKVDRVLKGHDRGILHLHGHWEDAESIVLGTSSYDDVVRDSHAGAVLTSMRMLRTLVFVGHGAELRDPNWGSFLDWAAKRFAGGEYKNYQIAREDEIPALRTPELQAHRIALVGYPGGHENLGPFLRSLVPEHTPAPLRPTTATAPASTSTRAPGAPSQSTDPTPAHVLLLVNIGENDHRFVAADDVRTHGGVPELVKVIEPQRRVLDLATATPRDWRAIARDLDRLIDGAEAAARESSGPVCFVIAGAAPLPVFAYLGYHAKRLVGTVLFLNRSDITGGWDHIGPFGGPGDFPPSLRSMFTYEAPSEFHDESGSVALFVACSTIYKCTPELLAPVTTAEDQALRCIYRVTSSGDPKLIPANALGAGDLRALAELVSKALEAAQERDSKSTELVLAFGGPVWVAFWLGWMLNARVAGNIEFPNFVRGTGYVRALSSQMWRQRWVSSQPKVLFLHREPDDEPGEDVGAQVATITFALRNGQGWHALSGVSSVAFRTVGGLVNLLDTKRPDIFHIDAHFGRLFSENGQITPAEHFLEVLRMTAIRPSLTVVCGNDSIKLATGLLELSDCVVNVGLVSNDKGVTLFIETFYSALARGRTVQSAFEQGQVSARAMLDSDPRPFELFSQGGVDPARMFFWRSPGRVATTPNPEEHRDWRGRSPLRATSGTSTIPHTFERFLSSLELTDKQRKDASDQHIYLRTQLQQRMSVQDNFLSGSYARNTAIRPLNDIDVFLVLQPKPGYGSASPSSVLAEVKGVLEKIYPGKTALSQNRSVNLEFSGTGIAYDVVPAFVSSPDVYIVPDRETNAWIKTNPKLHAERSTKANEHAGKKLKPLLKAVKHANLLHGGLARSFHLEVLSWGILETDPGSHLQGLVTLLSGLAARICDPCPDPAKLGPDIRPSLPKCEAARTWLRKMATLATEAKDLADIGRPEDAHSKLGEIFGDQWR